MVNGKGYIVKEVVNDVHAALNAQKILKVALIGYDSSPWLVRWDKDN